MAKKGTTEWKHGGFIGGNCDTCSADFADLVMNKKEKTHRLFENESFFNGESKCLRSLCDKCHDDFLLTNFN